MTIPIKVKWLQAINRFIYTTSSPSVTSSSRPLPPSSIKFSLGSDVILSEKDEEIEVKSSSSSFRFVPLTSTQIYPEGIELQPDLKSLELRDNEKSQVALKDSEVSSPPVWKSATKST